MFCSFTAIEVLFLRLDCQRLKLSFCMNDGDHQKRPQITEMLCHKLQYRVM